MLDGFRNSMARGLSVLAQRVSTEPRHPSQRRVGPYGRTVAGVVVTPDTALRNATCWAATRWLSQSVGMLPWQAMMAVKSGSEVQTSNPINYLLHKRPNPEWSSMQFRETLTHWALRRGNGWAEIERDTLNRPLALWPIHPDRAELCRDPDTAELYLDVNNGTGGKVQIPYADVFHLRGFGEGVLGVNVMDYAAQSIGWAMAAQTFGAAFFGNGALPAVVVRNKKGLTPKGLEAQRAEFEALHKGPSNSHRSAHLDVDAEIETIGYNVQETQIVEVHQHLVEEICRWFGVPPHKVMHLLRATFSNIEHQAIEAVVDCIQPWAKRFEDEADCKLFGQNRRNLFTKINLNGLLRGDMQARMNFYKGMQFVGAMSPNEIRSLEDMNGLGKEGDIHVMQQQMVPLEFIAQGPQKPAAPAPAVPASQDDAQNAAEEFFSLLNMEPANA